MNPITKRILERVSMKGKRIMPKYEFRHEMTRIRLRSEDMAYLMREMQKEGVIRIKRRNVELLK